jgi:hypothetical protein
VKIGCVDQKLFNGALLPMAEVFLQKELPKLDSGMFQRTVSYVLVTELHRLNYSL